MIGWRVARWLSACCGLSALSVAAVSCGTGAAAVDPSWNHYQVYEVVEVPAEHRVELSDQFDLPLEPARLEAQTHFANPTRKVHAAHQAGIGNVHHHLSWYRLAPQPEPRRTVRLHNQFGQQSIDLGEARYLLVPTQKTSDADSEFPKDLDHYRCYEVVRVNTVPPLPVVQLGDQFETVQGLQVGPPVLFCPPVRKVREGQEPIGVQNADNHLTIYELPARPLERGITVLDQFGDRDLRILRRVFLAVPTIKEVFVEHAP